MSFDPTTGMMPMAQPTKAQIRNMKIKENMMKFYDKEKGHYADQYIVVKPQDEQWPSKTSCVNAKQAATMIFDKQARLAKPEEIEAYKIEVETARQKVNKQIARQDLANAVQRTLRD